MAHRHRPLHGLRIATALVLLAGSAGPALADIDGHGPDAWRVTGVAAGDTLQARMGPGTQYPAIDTFAHNERGMQQVTCVPYFTLAHFEAMTPTQRDALPARWCLMRSASLAKAGWVAQRYITPDQSEPAAGAIEPTGDAIVDQAAGLVRDLYQANTRAEQSQGPDPLQAPAATAYFTPDIVALLAAGIGAHPLYGGQDFDGRIERIAPDAEQPMFRGMVTIHVDFINFGQPQRATYQLRADTTAPDAPLRIFRVEHDGWSYP